MANSSNLGLQFVDNLFIVRLRPNMSMCHAVIINYFLVHKIEVDNIIVNSQFALSLAKYPWHNRESKDQN